MWQLSFSLHVSFEEYGIRRYKVVIADDDIMSVHHTDSVIYLATIIYLPGMCVLVYQATVLFVDSGM